DVNSARMRNEFHIVQIEIAAVGLDSHLIISGRELDACDCGVEIVAPAVTRGGSKLNISAYIHTVEGYKHGPRTRPVAGYPSGYIIYARNRNRNVVCQPLARRYESKVVPAFSAVPNIHTVGKF